MRAIAVILVLAGVIASAMLSIELVVLAFATPFTNLSNIFVFDSNSSLVLIGAASVVAPLEPLCVSITSAARLLGVSRSAMYLLIKRGELRLFKIAGSRSAIKMAELRRYIAERKAAAPTQEPDDGNRGQGKGALAAPIAFAPPLQPPELPSPEQPA